MTTTKKAKHEEANTSLEKAAHSLKIGTLLTYYPAWPNNNPLAAIVASVHEGGVNLMVIEESGTPSNRTNITFHKTAPEGQQDAYCTLPE